MATPNPAIMSTVKTRAKTVKMMVARVLLPDVSIVPGEIKGIVGGLSDGLGGHCPWILGRYVNDGEFVIEEGAIRIGFSRIALPKDPINKRCHTKVDSHPPSLSLGLTTRLLAKKEKKRKAHCSAAVEVHWESGIFTAPRFKLGESSPRRGGWGRQADNNLTSTTTLHQHATA
jgi:hypothetical protein